MQFRRRDGLAPTQLSALRVVATPAVRTCISTLIANSIVGATTSIIVTWLLSTQVTKAKVEFVHPPPPTLKRVPPARWVNALMSTVGNFTVYIHPFPSFLRIAHTMAVCGGFHEPFQYILRFRIRPRLLVGNLRALRALRL